MTTIKTSTPMNKKYLALVFVVVGIVLIIMGIPEHSKITRMKEACTKSAVAYVEDYDSRTVGHGRDSHKEYRATLTIPHELGFKDDTAVTQWSDIRFSAYDTVKIKYDPSDHRKIYVPDNPPYDNGKMRIRLGIGCMIFAAGAFIVHLLRRGHE